MTGVESPVAGPVGVLARDFGVRLLNCSSSGCLLETSTPMEVGTTGTLRIVLNGKDLVDLRRSPDESRHYFLETLERDPGHQQARQLLAFVDGTLSEPERVQVCREMEVITQGTFVFDECVARGDTTRDRAERSER